MINYKEIEQKWQAEWSRAKVFEAEPNEKKPLLVTAAFPYVNSPQHIGHIRTYGTADSYARYKSKGEKNATTPRTIDIIQTAMYFEWFLCSSSFMNLTEETCEWKKLESIVTNAIPERSSQKKI